jgi:GntR family transcriptional regulator
MLLFTINPHSGVPVYRQIMDQVRYHLAAGSLVPGQQLPSIRELAHTLAVNPATIAKAYSELEHDRVIEMQRGRGAFIHASPPSMPRDQRRQRLRNLAERLAVEARQLGADDAEIRLALDQALTQLNRKRSS